MLWPKLDAMRLREDMDELERRKPHLITQVVHSIVKILIDLFRGVHKRFFNVLCRLG